MALSLCRSELINPSGYAANVGTVFERGCVLVGGEEYLNAVALKAGTDLPSSLAGIFPIGPKCFQENSGCPEEPLLRCFRGGGDGEAGLLYSGPSPMA